MPKYIEAVDFLSAAAKGFDFLIEEGFVPGACTGYRLLYASADFAVEVLFDDNDGRVLTLLDAHVGDRNPRANLICLFVESGLGPAQSVKETARSKRAVGIVVDSQAAALRKLLPALRSPSGPGLLLECHGT